MTELAGQRFLVTGGAGFIGSEVCAQLCEAGADVAILDNFSSGKLAFVEALPARIVRGEISDETITRLALKDCEIVIHLAALPYIPVSYIAPDEFFRVNSMGTVQLLWRAIQTESVERFVHISTSEVYGTARFAPITEEHPTTPHSTYAASKLAADRAAFTMHREHGFPVTIIRPFNSYGPRITQPYIIPEIACQLLEGKGEVTLGNVNASRDFTFVRDTARAIISASQEPKAIGETMNVGSGKDITIRELAELMAQITHVDLKIKIDAQRFRPFDVERLVSSSDKARKILGWQPQVTLKDGLELTIEWIRSQDFKYRYPGEPFREWINLWRLYNPRRKRADQ